MAAPLLPEVERFLIATGMSATGFGRKATRDPRFVLDMRNGREPRPSTAERVRAFMGNPS